MGMKKIYTCDICRDQVDPEKSFGVVFSGIKKFTLGGYGSTDGIHICYGCANQLSEHLSSNEIQKLLNGSL